MEFKKNPEIFFHAGLERTGTTFLQRSVFPKLKNIYYIPKNQYHNRDEIISNTNYSKYLLSHESKVIQEELKKFAAKYPNAKIILVFRRHDKWIASHYKRQIKNGYSRSFKEFIHLENDTGLWKKEDLYFLPKIKFIENCFRRPPVVLFHDELKSSPKDFVRKILEITGVEEHEPIPYKAKHTSYTDKELKVRRRVNQLPLLKTIEVNKHKKFRTAKKLYNKTIRYPTLHLGRLIPESFLSSEPLIPKEELEKIREFYEKDWENIKEYARKNNPIT
jgi:hypothetical protein